MKKFLFTLLVAALSLPALAQDMADKVVKFKAEVIDLGKIEQGTPTTATFYFTNISKQPVIIEQANPTCGCTIGDYTKAPVSSGKEGWIKATYNAATLGAFDKKMTVKFAGIDGYKDIIIKGEVLSKEEYAKYKKTQKKI
jgi:hypothetical protein